VGLLHGDLGERGARGPRTPAPAVPKTKVPALPADSVRKLREAGITTTDIANLHAGKVTSDQLAAKSNRYVKAKRVAATRKQYAGSGMKVNAAGIVEVPLKGPLEKGVSNLIDAAAYTPAGIVHAAQTFHKDSVATNKGDWSFKRSRQLGKEVATSMKQDVEHPLRNPGYTALDLLAAVGGVAGGVSRLGAAGRALSEGGVRAALTRAPAEGGSLLRSPAPGTRTYEHGGIQVKVPNSTHPAVRAVQRGHAKLLNANPDTNYSLIHRDGSSAARKVGKEIANERRVTEAVERAPAAALAHRAKKLTTPQQTALRVVAEGKPIDERIRFHQEQAAAGTGQQVREHRQKAALLEASRRYVDETGGKPALKKQFARGLVGGGANAKELRDTYAAMLKVSRSRESLLKDIGAVDEGRIEARLHGPGRVIAGARMETQKEANAARGVRARRAHVEQTREYPGRSRTVERDMTLDEAKTRLAQLDAQHDALVHRLIPETSPYASGGADRKAEQLTRNFENSRAGKGKYRGVTKRQTVSDEEYRIAEAKLHDVVERNPGSAAAKRIGALLDERQTLRDAVTGQAEAAFTGDAAPPLGKVTETIPGKPRRVRLREQAARKGERATPRLAGAEDFKGGQMRVPYTASTPPRSQGRAAEYRGGTPRAPGSTTKPFTGGLLRSGNFRDDTARQVAESGVEAQRYGSVLRLRGRILHGASDTYKPGYVAVRTDNLKNRPLPARVHELAQKAEDGVKLSRDERLYLRDQNQKLYDDIFDKHLTANDGERVEGVKWVPPELLKQIGDRSVLADAINSSRPAHVVDEINSATKLAVLYLKPAYAAPNIAGNAFLTIVHQGFAAPRNLREAALLNAHLGPDATAVLDEAVGEGIASALAGHGTGAASRGAQKAAGAWSKIVDKPFRRAAFLHEARKLGYNTDARLHELLLDPQHREALVEVSQRANNALIDYGKLGPNERAIIRRAIFFYPWVKGSTMYAGRLVRDNPVKADVLAQTGREGQEHADLGPVPSIYKGSFKLGGKLVNPAAASVLGTPGQVLEAVKGLAHGQFTQAADLSSFLTPVLRLAGAEVFRRNSFGNSYPATASAYDIAKDTLVKSTPQYRLAEQLKQGDTPSPDRVFPGGSPKEALLRFGVGSSWPRTYNPDALHAQAEKEQRALMSPAQRNTVDDKKFRVELVKALRTHGGVGKIPEPVAAALDVRLQRKQALQAAQDHVGHKLSPVERFAADVALLVQMKRMTPDEAKQALQWSAHASERRVNSAREYLTRSYFDGQILTETVRYLNQHGADLSSP
jgi:hypothetical protein